MEWQGQQVEVVPNRWIVMLEHGVPEFNRGGDLVSLGVKFNPGRQEEIDKKDKLKKTGLAGLTFERHLGVDHMFTVSTPSGVPSGALEKALKKLPGFKSVEPVLVWKSDGTFLPAAGTPTTPYAGTANDTQFTQQWALEQSSDKDIDATEAWDYTRGYSGTAVAVIDSGVDLQHPDIDGNIWVNPGEIPGDGIDNDGNGKIDDVNGWDFFGRTDGTYIYPDNDPDDTFGHGTSVAGIIAAEGNNRADIAGVSWYSKIIPLRAGPSVSLYTDLIAAGINYVNDLRLNRGINVPVINISAGGSGTTPSLTNAIALARDNGILVIAAAGNSSGNNDAQPQYPASYTNPDPGDDNVIAVAASNRVDGRAQFNNGQFSNIGRVSVDLAAPGDDIVTLKIGGGTTTVEGTSFAAPFVTGVVSLAYSLKPDLKYTEVRDAILNNVDKVRAFNDPNGDGSNADRIVASGGRLNALRTLQALYTGARKTIIGDLNTGAVADDFYVRPHPSDSTITQILRYQSGGYQPFGDLPNRSDQRLDLYGIGGDDAVTVAAGVNNPVYVSGGGGHDTLNATAAGNRVTLAGDGGNDTLRGGSANDSLEGGSGNDVLYGNAGSDVLNGVKGNDFIYAGLGNDSIFGGDGEDSLYGEAGNDFFARTNDGVKDIVDGGSGTDTLDGGLRDSIDVLTSIEVLA